MNKNLINIYFDAFLNQNFKKINILQNKFKLSDVNYNKDTIFHYILKNCDKQYILKNIINAYPQIITLINYKNNLNQTPIHLICMKQMNEIYNLIIKNSIKNLINIKDNNGYTPYEYSIISKKLNFFINNYIYNYLIYTNKEFYQLIKNINYTNYNIIEQQLNLLLKNIFNKNPFIEIPNIGKIYKIKKMIIYIIIFWIIFIKIKIFIIIIILK